MWSDPEEIDTWAQNQRGAGWLFGEKVVDDFCRFNNVKLIARAHQLVQEGYQEWFTNKNLVTIWSAPNYCYRSNNLASFMKVDEHMDYTFTTFKEDDRSRDSKHYRQVMPYFL
jgi:serine/threonine-protein phosphatase 6 catalytic subunit